MPYFLTILGVLGRLIPHPWNFTPIGALGLFAGANCSPKVAWLVPLVALVIGDVIIGIYSPLVGSYAPVMVLCVYAGFMAAPLVGRLLLSRRRSVLRVGTAVVTTTTIFFVVSNFGVWLSYHPHTWAGFVDCYVLAIPYYGGTLLGDAIYATILFGGQEIVSTLSRRRESQRPGY
jgi:hypothetical protein